MNKIVYVDMDNVLVDFKTGIEKLSQAELELYEGRYDEVPHIFSKMEPMENAIASYIKLCSKYDTYILSTSPWENPTALNDKLYQIPHKLTHINSVRYNADMTFI
jgi:5'-nucleotidase